MVADDLVIQGTGASAAMVLHIDLVFPKYSGFNIRWAYMLLSHPSIPGVTLSFFTGSYAPPATESCSRDNF